MDLQQLVTNYGYIAIFIGTFLEGETILIIGGFLAHRDYLALPWVIVAAFAGTLAGDQLYFYIGRIKGQKFIAQRPKWQAKTGRIFNFLDRHETLFIIGFRFIYGIRTVTPFVLGTSGIPALRFLVLNIFGAALWALVIGVLGYYFGQALEILVADVKRYESWVIIGLVGVMLTIWLYTYLRRRNSP